MLLKERINKDIILAMKNKEQEKKDVLRVLKGEIERSDTKTDNDIISLVKKMVENIQLTTQNTTEVNVLSAYLPRPLSNVEINSIVNEQIASNEYSSASDMGSIMNFFKSEYNGQYDGKEVSTIVRAKLVK